MVCSLNEMCFLMLYVKAFMKGPMLFGNVSAADFVLYGSLPVCVLKQIISLGQIKSAHDSISEALRGMEKNE